MSNLRILVVDDDEGWGKPLSQILERDLSNDATVVSTNNHKTALNYVSEERYDLIIVDLPLWVDSSGPQSENDYSFEFLDAVRQSQINKYSVLIVLTAVFNNLPRIKLAQRDFNVHDVIDKATFNTHDFLECVHAAIEDMPEAQQSIEFSIEQADITFFQADVIALKYAQRFFGTDEIIAHLLNEAGIAIETLCPDIGDYRYIETRNCIQARYALFVGVPNVIDFNYQHIQEFAKRVLNILAYQAPNTKHLVMTIHGAGFGLDETEAFLSQFKGYINALQSGQFPQYLKKITIIDRNLERVQRLREAFDINFSKVDFVSKISNKQTYGINIRRLMSNFKGNQLSYGVSERGRIDSDTKRHVFVAMPFKKDMDDVFYYGIQQPVRSAGFVCERIDQEAFIGDILDQVKKKIDMAAVVIAELSGANPNVYLEVGYAWGKGCPTILLMKDDQELRFDVRGQRCLNYERIKDLEESLQKELEELKSQKFI